MGITHITGTVTGPSGKERTVRFLVDSGATYTLLPQALVEGWKKILSLSGANARALGQAARARIVREFSRERLVARTEEALQGLLKRG